jgi:hypothetical protein
MPRTNRSLRLQNSAVLFLCCSFVLGYPSTNSQSDRGGVVCERWEETGSERTRAAREGRRVEREGGRRDGRLPQCAGLPQCALP